MTDTATEEGWREAKCLKGPGIPVPTGQYRVGCVDFMHHFKGDRRGSLLFRLHYPTQARPEEGYAYATWYPHNQYIQRYLEFEGLDFNLAVISEFSSPKVPALEGAPLITEAALLAGGGLLARPTLPVVVFSHGLGAMRTCYSAAACDLASHGYLVACVEHRDGSATASLQKVPTPGGEEGQLQDQWIEYHRMQESENEFKLRNKQVKIRVEDVKSCLDILHLLNEGEEMRNMMGGMFCFKQFQGRMELAMAAIMGHSFGGATTILTLSEDSRFKCGIAMDCWMVPLHRDFYQEIANVPSPLYFINSYHFQWKQNIQKMMSLVKPPDSDGKTSCRVLTLKGTHHFNQCDIPFVSLNTLHRLGLIHELGLDSVVAHRLNMDICYAFLQRHLLKDPAYQLTVPNLDGNEGHSKHLIFGTNLS